MQTFRSLTKLLVILAFCPSFLAAELVILFEDEAAFSRFVERGFEVSTEARGSVSGEGGDVTKPFSRGVAIYRVTESGMRLEATLFGTRFWPDEGLNPPDPVEND